MMKPVAFTQFDSALHMEFAPEESLALRKDYHRVLRTIEYTVKQSSGRMLSVVIPRGYLFDGASVPRSFWWFMPPHGRHSQAAALHDYLCEYGYAVDVVENKLILLSRRVADDIFLDALKLLGVPRLQGKGAHLAVSAYRVLMRKRKPSLNRDKAILERAWVREYPLGDEG